MRLKTFTALTFLTLSIHVTPSIAWACTNGTNGTFPGGGGMQGDGVGCHGGDGGNNPDGIGGQGGMGVNGADGGNGGAGKPGGSGGIPIPGSDGTIGKSGNQGPNLRVIPTDSNSPL